MHQSNLGALFNRISIDTAGPFPHSQKGNQYLLITTHYFTKWLKDYTIPNQVALMVADVLVTNFFFHFGVLRELRNNQGPEL
jgi:hypothetical protein